MLKKYAIVLLGLFFSINACAVDESKVLDFPLVGIEGKGQRLSDYRGQWVVLNYWASWCPPCRHEIPDLIQFHQMRDDVSVIGINQERVNAEQLKELVDRFDISYPVYFDLRGMKGKISDILPVRGLPTSYFITPDGRAVYEHVGPITYQGLEDRIEQLKKIHTPAEKTAVKSI